MGRAAGVVLLGLVLVALAGVFDASPLYVPGVAFVLLGVLSTAWVELAARRVHVRRELDVRRVVEDEPIPVRIEVGCGRLPLPVAAVEDPLLESPLRLPAGARTRSFTVVARFGRRGRRRIPAPVVVLRDPLELARRVVRGSGEGELLVLPRTSEVALAQRRAEDGRAGGLAALLGAAATDVDGLRPYREGTPAAHIHWPTLARGAGLMERRLRVEADARPLVVLDARGAASRDELDAAVRAAASLTLSFARAGGCALLLPGDRRPLSIGEDLAGWPAAHVRLALVEGGEQTPGPALGSAGSRRGALVYVSAQRVDRLPPAARALARGSATLVVPGRLPGRESRFAVAGCNGYAQSLGRGPRSSRGRQAMTATASPPPTPTPSPPRRASRPGTPLLSAPLARLLTLSALAIYAALRWSTLVEPSGAGRMLVLLLLALAAGLGVGQLSRLPPLAQAPAAVLVVIVWAAASAIASGAPASLVLEPRHWDDLGLGLQQGIEQLPQVIVPYSQPDPWPRIAILLGGALLLALGAVLGLSPGRHGIPLRDAAPFGGGVGLRLAAATPLIAAAIIPPTIMEPDAPALEGIVLFVLLAGFLWLERLPRRHVPFAAGLLLLAVLGGAVGVPYLDRKEPWVDVQELVGGLDRPDPARFDWSQSYGPLDWPRTGREVLRITSPVESYWKAQNLDGFDGVRWIRAAPADPFTPESEVPAPARANRDWRASVRVTVREFSTSDVVGAGTTTGFEQEPTNFSPGTSPGTWVSDEPLEPGDGYVAETIVPRPRQAALSTAPADYPASLQQYLLVGLPQQDPARPSLYEPGPSVVFAPPFGSSGPGSPQAIVAKRQFDASPYADTYALAQRIASGATTPYAYVQRVLGYFRRGFAYSETPPRRQLPIEAFLFRDRAGYCQQFAGAAALLLRMGGLPARVSAGFTSGSRDGARDEYVVRDYDAHAWVEVWFPQIGWVQFDPTPSTAPAISGRAPEPTPASTTATPAALPRAPAATTRTEPGQASSPGTSGDDGGGSGWSPATAIALVLVVLAAAAGVFALHRRLRPPAGADALLAELERALRRTGRPPEPGLTLMALERRLHDAPEAAGYVRALRMARFGGGGGGGAAPLVTARQRRALRTELARGLGLGGRLRALYALPPRFGR